MGETALHEECSTSISPPLRPQHQNVQYAKTDLGWVSLKAPQSKAVFVPLAVNGTWMLSVQWCRPGHSPQTNPRVPHWSMRRLTGLRNMAANILLRSYGFTLNKGARLAYVGQILLGAIWSTQRWPRTSNQERKLKISCLEMLPLKISSLARTCESSEPLWGLVPGQHPDRIRFFHTPVEATVRTQTWSTTMMEKGQWEVHGVKEKHISHNQPLRSGAT